MENSNSEQSKFHKSLDMILNNMQGLKFIIRDSYKKIKCNSEKEQEILTQNFEKLFLTLNEIHKESFNLDEMKIWEDILIETDTNKIDELEKKIYNEFIFASQLARGKVKKIKEFNDKINTSHLDLKSYSKPTEFIIANNSNTVLEMDIDNIK